MALVDKPIEFMLSAIVMCVQHTASISAVVASIFMANSFFIRSVSLRAGCVFPSPHLWEVTSIG